MESEIFKFILSNQGSVDTEELVYNLCDHALLTEIICKSDKFVSCLFAGRPRVFVRSRVTVCRARSCQGCRRLHLCLGFLFSGSCPFSHLKRGCSFSHDLHSDHNKEVLKKFDLETLNRTELCLLLLQSDNTLLPSICYHYNSRGGCQGESQGECPWLHVCERFLSRDCNCPRTHDFSSPQPLKLLQDKHIPDHLFKLLKFIYANKQALRLADKGKATSNPDINNSEAADSSQDTQNPAYDSDSSTSSKQSSGRGKRGRGRRGGRGHARASGENRQHDGTPSRGESRDSTNPDLTQDDDPTDSGQPDPKTAEESLHDDYDSDSSSVSHSKDKIGKKRGGFRGNTRGRRADGNNASEGSRRENPGNFKGKLRGGKGRQGNSATLSKDDLQAADNLGDTNAELNQNPSQSRGATGDTGNDSAASNNQSSSMKSGNSCGTKGKTHVSGSDKPQDRTAASASKVSAADGSSNQQQRRQRDKKEICMFFIKGHCKHEDHCFKAHDKMPYRWEIKQSGQWTPMADNEKIEKDYCDPESTYSTTNPPVHFDTMTSKSDEVRRLSTINSVLEPDFIHTTDWLWYWEDEYGKWYQYAAITSEHRLSSITSKELEEWYQINNKDVVTFTAGSQSYELSFQDMIQTNLQYGTKRLVRRRPRFVSATEVQTTRKRPTLSNAVPDYWDKTKISRIGYKTVPLQPSSGEYKEIQDLFRQTMSGFEILKVERIQNKTVWEAFQLHKTHMKRKNGGQPVLEKKLFHGTDPKHVDTICQANFDWRVCGVNGTVYGQGSYFARDAYYSHDYTGDCDPRFMFVSRVLVGEFTQGSSEYRRPPSKDGGDVNLFDSCVNDMVNPSIFVVFKEQQIYPEYLIQYRQTGRSNLYTQSRQTSYPLFRTTPLPTVPTRGANAPPVNPSVSVSNQANTATATDNQSSCVIS